MYRFDVVGIGNPLLDRMVSLPDERFPAGVISKGTMRLIGDEDARHLAGWLTEQRREARVYAGGSCCNTMVGVATLGGAAALLGAVGTDEHAAIFEGELRKRGVEPCLVRYPGSTGSCVVFITPDAERTMNTHLGVSSLLSAEDISPNVILRGKFLHLEGYLWDTPGQRKAALAAMDIASAARIPVSLDLADPFAVERHAEAFREALPRIDILFANEREASLFTGAAPEEAVRILGKKVPFVAVKLGAKGSLISFKGKVHAIPAYPVTPVDTTGAGDMYAGACLLGLARGYSPAQIGKLASYASARVVSQEGAQLASPLQGDVERIIGAT